MKKSFKQFIDDTRKISLSEVEKASMKAALLARMKGSGEISEPKTAARFEPAKSALPVKAAPQSIEVKKPVQKKWTLEFRSLLDYEISTAKSLLVVALTLVLICGGGLSYAAEGTLPGDILYPLKVNFDEKLAGLVAFSPEARAAYKVKLVSTRLEEAEKLASEGRLTPVLAEFVAAGFDKYANAAESDIASFKVKYATSSTVSASDQNASLEAHLKAHSVILNNIMDGAAKDSENVNQVTSKVQMKLDSITEKRIDSVQSEMKVASTTVGLSVAASGKRSAAESKIQEVQQYIQNKKATSDPALWNEANDKLDSANSIFSSADVKMLADDFNSAFSRFQDAARLAEEAKVLLSAGDSIKWSDFGGFGKSIRASQVSTTSAATSSPANKDTKENIPRKSISSTTPDAASSSTSTQSKPPKKGDILENIETGGD